MNRIVLVVLIIVAAFLGVNAGDSSPVQASDSDLKKITPEQLRGVLRYEKVLEKERQCRHNSAVAKARDQARKLANHHTLVVSQYRRSQADGGPRGTEIELSVTVVTPDGTPVARLTPDQSHDFFVAFDPETGGLNLTEEVCFKLLGEPAGNPKKVSSWVTPVTLSKQKGDWVSE